MKPIKTFRLGTLKVSVWKREDTEHFMFFKKREAKWQLIESFDADDVSLMLILLKRVEEYVIDEM